MLKLIVCVKQVPRVSELPWDPKRGALRRDLADGMMDPAAKRALEAALRIKDARPARVTAICMGPPMAEATLREALALGADAGLLITDGRLAGADTLITTTVLAAAIRSRCPDFHLVLCGRQTSDSETAQVGPQLAEALEVAGVAYVEHLEILPDAESEGEAAPESGASQMDCGMDRDIGRIRVRRLCDGFLETLEMAPPAVITISDREYRPRHAPMAGLQTAFEKGVVETLDAAALGLPPDLSAAARSPTRILRVYSPAAEKRNVALRGSASKIVEALFQQYDDRIGGAAGRDIKPPEEE